MLINDRVIKVTAIGQITIDLNMTRLYLDAVLFSGHSVSMKITHTHTHTHTLSCATSPLCRTDWQHDLDYSSCLMQHSGHWPLRVRVCVCVQVSRRWSKIMWRSPRRWRRAAWLTWSSGRAGVNPRTRPAPSSRTSRHTRICPRESRRRDSLQVRDAPYLITSVLCGFTFTFFCCCWFALFYYIF